MGLQRVVLWELGGRWDAVCCKSSDVSRLPGRDEDNGAAAVWRHDCLLEDCSQITKNKIEY
jgi:hypothetical protein